MPGSLAHSSSGAERPLPLRARPDLEFVRQEGRAGARWVVKDPVALRYFRLRDEEYQILRALNGQATELSILASFEQRFAPRRLHAAHLRSFLGLLHRQNLILSDAPGQGRLRHELAASEKQRAQLATMTNILAIRLPGISTGRLLDRLYPPWRWLFSARALGVLIGLLLLIGILAIAHTNQAQFRWRELSRLFDLASVPGWLVALAVAKAWHELGHALACRHFGVDCREMGILLLFFTPTVYCDTSDAWMLPNRWQRAAIGAAGMYFEAWLGAASGLVWFCTEAGLLHSLCLSLFVSCAVSTLVINANPLLRYDGYYILTDLLGTPNLWQQSRQVVASFLRRICLGITDRADRMQIIRHRFWYGCYGIASCGARWFALGSLFWVVLRIASAHRLQAVAWGLLCLALLGPLARAVFQGVRMMKTPSGENRIRGTRLAGTLLACAALLACLFMIRVPHWIGANVLLEPRAAHAVYVTVPGLLDEQDVHEGETVRPGQRLGRLTNRDLELDVARLVGERDRQAMIVRNLHRQRLLLSDAGASIPRAEETLRHLDEQWRQRVAERRRLELRADVGGQVLPFVPTRSDRAIAEGRVLAHGSPLDPDFKGSLLEVGSVYCQIGDPTKLEAILAIDQTSVELVQVGQQVHLQFDELPGTVWIGTIREVSQLEQFQDQNARRNAARGESPAARDVLDTVYQARVLLDDPSGTLRIGARGHARIHAESLPLASRILRYFSRTFRFLI